MLFARAAARRFPSGVRSLPAAVRRTFRKGRALTQAGDTAAEAADRGATEAGRRGWREALAVYAHGPVIAMLFLGFSAGLPFLLVFSTLSAWLTEAEATRTAIGFFSWVGLTYSIKVFWAPAVDRLPLPWATRALGRRRSWMLLAMIGIAAGLLGMSRVDPAQDLAAMALFALLVAFSSATQDVAVDAWRIEAVPAELQGAMAATYQLGYRIAILVSGGGALILADRIPWPATYMTMACLTLVGMATALAIREPARPANPASDERERRMAETLARAARLPAALRGPWAWFVGAFIGPFSDFFGRMGMFGLAILAFIGLFRVCDVLMGAMANPFYLDTGFTKTEIGAVVKFGGTAATVAGALLGGILVARFGLYRPLIAAAALLALTNLLFAALAAIGAELWMLGVTIGADNLSAGFAGTVFIAYLSQLTSLAYTATQYALFSSLMTLPGKFLAGFSGIVVDAHGYAVLFVGTAAAGIPAVFLAVVMKRRAARRDVAQTAAPP